jgi:hypothetical protein
LYEYLTVVYVAIQQATDTALNYRKIQALGLQKLRFYRCNYIVHI